MKKVSQLNTAPDQSSQDDGLSFGDILFLLNDGWHWLAGGLVIGLVGAVAFLVVMPPQYETTAVIVPAKVLGAEVESSAQLLERLKFPTFYDAETVEICGVSGGSQAALASAVKSSLLKGGALLQLNYRAPSKELARLCLERVLLVISKEQNKVSEPLVLHAKSILELNRRELEEAEILHNKIEKHALTFNREDARFSQSMILLSAALVKLDEMSRLRKTVQEQTSALLEPHTVDARLLQPMYTSGGAVWPKKTPILAGGVFGGVLLGGLAFFARRSWKVLGVKLARTVG